MAKVGPEESALRVFLLWSALESLYVINSPRSLSRLEYLPESTIEQATDLEPKVPATEWPWTPSRGVQIRQDHNAPPFRPLWPQTLASSLNPSLILKELALELGESITIRIPFTKQLGVWEEGRRDRCCVQVSRLLRKEYPNAMIRACRRPFSLFRGKQKGKGSGRVAMGVLPSPRMSLRDSLILKRNFWSSWGVIGKLEMRTRTFRGWRSLLGTVVMAGCHKPGPVRKVK